MLLSAPFRCSFSSLSLFLSLSPFLSSSRPNFHSVLLRLLRHRPFLFLSSNLILFPFHLYASAIITGEPTVQIFNLVWQMADLEARSAFAGRDKRRSPSMYVRSCELAEIFRRDKTTLFAGVELLRVPLLSLFLFFLSFLRIAIFPSPFPSFSERVRMSFPSLTSPFRIRARKRDL